MKRTEVIWCEMGLWRPWFRVRELVTGAVPVGAVQSTRSSVCRRGEVTAEGGSGAGRVDRVTRGADSGTGGGPCPSCWDTSSSSEATVLPQVTCTSGLRL